MAAWTDSADRRQGAYTSDCDPEEGLNYRFPGGTRPLPSMLDRYMAAPEWWLEIFDLTTIP